MASVGEHHKYVPEKLLMIYKCLNEFRLQNMFCDVTIKVGTDTFHAHGGVLCAHSSYFREKLKEIKGEKVVELTDIEPSIVRSCVEFMYTGEIEIKFENVKKIIDAARFLNLKEVEDMCEKELSNFIDIDRGMLVRRMTDSFGYKKLYHNAGLFLGKNFAEVAKSDAFLDYTKEEVEFVINNKVLARPQEEMRVWYAVIKWVKHDRENREAVFPDLLKLVKLDNLTINFMNESIRSELMVMRSDTCMNFLLHHLFARLGSRGLPQD